MAQPFKSPTGVYQLRRKVPPELRQALGHEYKRSLKTRDPAEAKARFAVEWAQSEEVFSLARAQSQGVSQLGARDMQQLASRWFRAELEKLEQSGDFSPWLVEDGTWVSEQGNHSQEHTPLISVRQALEEDDGPDFTAEIDAIIGKTLRESNVPKPTDADAQKLLRDVFWDHWLKLSDVALMRSRGDWGPLVGVIEREPLALEKRAAKTTQSTKLLSLFETYSEDKKLNDGDTRSVRKTLLSYRAIVEQFIELFGDVSLRQIGREMIRQYRADLAAMPAKGEGIRKLSAKQLIEKAKAESLPLVTPATVRNKLRALSAVLSHGLRLGLLTENPVIAGGVGKAAAKAASGRAGIAKRRKEYTKDELAAIFSSPIFSKNGWSSPRAKFGKALYWMPLLMYYTGARREELAQLDAKDVKFGLGVHYLSILATPDEDDDAGRTVKTEGSRRQVPLHPDLIAGGFLAYVASVPGDGKLFPMLKPDPNGFYGANFGKRWANYLREVVSLRSAASPSHGFRHSFKTLSREVGIPEDVHDAITGHVGNGAAARDYGSMPLKRMDEEIAKFPSLAFLAQPPEQVVQSL